MAGWGENPGDYYLIPCLVIFSVQWADVMHPPWTGVLFPPFHQTIQALIHSFERPIQTRPGILK